VKTSLPAKTGPLVRRVRRWLRRGTDPAPFNLDLIASPRWDERAEAAVGLLAAHLRTLSSASGALRIADFGCGDERLRRVLEHRLPRPHEYQGYDLLPQRETVVELDLSRSLPEVGFDVVVCLGLLEYIDPLAPFLARLQQRYPAAVVSYALYDAPQPLRKRERRARGWRSDYSAAALEREFDDSGFLRRDFCLTNQGRTGVWLLLSQPRI
jgi:SAM-dependent methyltransferase